MSKELQIPQAITAFIEATNRHDTDGLLATLTDNAIITDEGQEHRGIAAIKTWSDEKYVGAKVTLEVVDAVTNGDKTIVTVKVDGNFDKTGLPDPFLMDFHFTTHAGRIAALNIRLVGE
jgi:ketosteroid isomerase-like protein